MKVCIIDDNASITGMFSKFLTMKGYETEVHNGGREGLARLNEEIFDVVLLDISMPEFSGIDVINDLTDSGRIKEQKILVLTASSSSLEELGEKLRGVKEVLKKPIQLSTLLEKVERYTKE